MRQARQGEELLNNPDEYWLRSTYCGAVDRGEVGPEAFRLRPDDGGELSGVRSSVQSPKAAEQARAVRSKAAGRTPNSGGTWGITVDQLSLLSLQCFDDTNVARKKPLPTGHAFIDLVHLTKDEARHVAIELAEAANENGCLAYGGISELK